MTERTSKFRPHKYITYVTFDMVFPNGPGREHATEWQTTKSGPLPLNNNCQRFTYFISEWIFRNLTLEGLISDLENFGCKNSIPGIQFTFYFQKSTI